MICMENLVAEVIESYTSAVYAKDVEALMRLYESSARIFDTWGVWSYESAASWRQSVEGWLTSLDQERVTVTFDDVKIVADLEFASVSAVVTYANISPEGAPLRAMQNRLSWALRLNEGVLRIVHEHTSAPVGFEDMKAILQRARAE